MNIFEHVVVMTDGRPLPLERYRNQPILLVTFQPGSDRLPQLWKMQRLYNDLRHSGLLVLGLPCPTMTESEDETGSEFGQKELQEDVIERFALRFPVAQPLHVRGPEVHPLFRELRDVHGRDVLPKSGPHKYLFDRRGDLVKHWPGRVEPDHPRFRHDVQSHLQAWVV